MSFAQDNGYTPATFSEIMGAIREGVNLQFGTTYTADNFIGTNWYKYFYSLVQKILENEVKASEIFLKLQEYIATTNARIQRPTTSHPGLIDSFEANGYTASVKPIVEADAGKISICVDTDPDAIDYPDTKLAICEMVRDFVAAGIVSEGSETETITLSNGQEFDFSFSLPTKTPILVRVTIITSDNNLLRVPGDEEIRQLVFDAIFGVEADEETETVAVAPRYRLGWNFEPQRYFNLADAPYAESVLVEWTDDDGDNWHDEVNVLEFDDLLTMGLEDIQILVDP